MIKRLNFIAFLLFLVWAGLAFRISYIQLYKSREFKDLGASQHLREVSLEAQRGDILDRNGNRLAMDLAYYDFEAYPRYMTDPQKVVAAFASELGKTRSYYRERLKKNRNFIYMARKVGPENADRIASQKLSGVQRFVHFNRFYPYPQYTGHLLGFSNIDNKGIEGLELKFNPVLAGAQGKMIMKSDALGKRSTDYNHPVVSPENGDDIVTSIDIDCQMIAVEELTKAIKKHNAIGGSVVLLDPYTSEVLAMASFPTFNNMNYSGYAADTRRNRTITDIFEPGSIYKLVTAAAALEKRVITPETEVFCENGLVIIGKHKFHDTKSYGDLSFKDVIAKSSNIGTFKVAQMVGETDIFKYSQMFGFGTKSGIDMPGEVAGMLKNPSQWSKTSLSSIAIGQEVAVNTLQIVNAYAALANGGTLMKPYVVKGVISKNGAHITEFNPIPIRRVVSIETAKILNTFFEEVTTTGTGKNLKPINGKLIAGKTGTAQKIDTETKAYSKTDYISSFVGYYPSDNPKIVGIVVLDTPRKGGYYGGTVAGPALRNIFQRYCSLPVNTPFTRKQTLVSDESGEGFWNSLSGLMTMFKNNDTITKSTSASENIKLQDNKDQKPVLISLDTENAKQTDKMSSVTVPDVRGESIRDAARMLRNSGLDVEINGTGIVVTQIPVPGKKVTSGTVAVIKAQQKDHDK